MNDILIDKMVPKLYAWAEKLNEDNKKGLRIIHKVVEVEGKKRFKVDG
jgi:hypothetical protein